MRAALLLLALPFAAAAQGFPDPGPTCYSWEGGHKSAGSFFQCNPELKPFKPVAQAPVVVAPAAVKPEVLILESTCPPPEPKVQPPSARREAGQC